MTKILIIEDDKDISDMLRKLLENNGYSVSRAFSGTEGLLLLGDDISLILMDLMLPGKNGEEIIEELKKKSSAPVIVMSAIGDIEKKVDLFKLGANDYVTKPFYNDELLARIKVHLKSVRDTVPSVLRYKDIELDMGDFTVRCHGIDVGLTRHEFELLRTLMGSPKRVFTKSMLFDLVWGDEDSADDNTLNVHISKIRTKLKKCSPDEEYIETIWSVGYRMKKDGDNGRN